MCPLLLFETRAAVAAAASTANGGVKLTMRIARPTEQSSLENEPQAGSFNAFAIATRLVRSVADGIIIFPQSPQSQAETNGGGSLKDLSGRVDNPVDVPRDKECVENRHTDRQTKAQRNRYSRCPPVNDRSATIIIF